MENTQLLEEKRTWKNEKEKWQDSDSMKTQQIKQLTQENEDLNKQLLICGKERYSLHDSLIDEKPQNPPVERSTEDSPTQAKILKNETKELLEKMKEKDILITRLQQELTALTDDRCDLQSVLKNLNERMADVTETRSKMDVDLIQLSQEKIQSKIEAREWQRKCEILEKQNKDTFDSQQKQQQQHIDCLKAEIEQLQRDLEIELNEKNAKDKQLKTVTNRVNKLMMINSQLEEQVKNF